MKKKIYNVVSIILLLCCMLVLGSVKNIEVNASIDDKVKAKSYIVIDANGKVLSEKNCDEKREVASICKLMTTLITLEEIEKGNLSLDDKVFASEYACAVEGSQAFLDAGNKYSVRELLKSVIIASANDSAIVLAETIAGTEDSFVDLMNDKAKELGMFNTLYGNSTGLSDKNHYSTARDTAIILNEVSDYQLYKEDCKIWMDELIHPSGRKTELVNTNRLIKYYPNCISGKTGFTDEAGYCLSSTAINDNLKLTCVVLGCESSADRFSDSVVLYNDAYAKYKSEKVVDKTLESKHHINVLRGKYNEVIVVPADDYYLTTLKNSKDQYEILYEFFDNIKAPVSEGDVIGIAKVIVDSDVIGAVDLISKSNIGKENLKDIFVKITEEFNFLNHK